MSHSISAYNAELSDRDRSIAERLELAIRTHLPMAEGKVWHRTPVLFIDGNPVAGYAARKDGVALLFWSGQSFDEPGLTPSGSFKMAELRMHRPDDVDDETLSRWLQKAHTIQWDYKNIIKRKGELIRL
jgi:hypothetical protein